MRKEGKAFFLERKKQRTFAPETLLVLDRCGVVRRSLSGAKNYHHPNLISAMSSAIFRKEAKLSGQIFASRAMRLASVLWRLGAALPLSICCGCDPVYDLLVNKSSKPLQVSIESRFGMEHFFVAPFGATLSKMGPEPPSPIQVRLSGRQQLVIYSGKTCGGFSTLVIQPDLSTRCN